MSEPTLRTPRTELRPLSIDDLDSIHALWKDPAVRRYLWDDVVIDRERAAEVVSRSSIDFAERGYGLWGARLSGSPELIGFCGLRHSEGRSPELLYGFLPRWWGQGLATEVATAVLGYAFSVLRQTRVVAVTDVPNPTSSRLLERLRMTCTGRGGLDGLDTLFYELASADFHDARARG